MKRWDRFRAAPWRRLPWVRGTLMAAYPLFLVYLCQLITLQDGAAAAAWVDGHTAAVFWTYGVLFLAEAAVLALTGRLFPAALVVTLPTVLFAVANHLKEAVNGAPILASDLAMAGQAGEIASFLRPGMDLGSGTAAGLWLAAGGVALAFLFSRGRGSRPRRERLLGGALALSLLLNLLWGPAAAALLPGEEGESQSQRNDRLGLLAGITAALRESAMEAPGDYSENSMNRILLELEGRQEAADSGGTRPNVVLIVSESFFDVTRLPGVTFREDPIPTFRALREAYGGGTFLSGAYAGGTGNVEMELFTGIPSAFPGAAESLTSLSGEDAYERAPSLVKTFAGQGYQIVMVHSYNDSLYNRARNMPAIGFDTVLYDRDFTVEKTYAGGYLSDSTLARQLIAAFEAKEEGPIFLYGLSMENHQPYFSGKFDAPSGVDYDAPALTGEALGAFDALVHGLRDADAALGELVDYFSNCEEPVLLIFLGDHLPGLSLEGGGSIYARLGAVDSSDTGDWDAETMERMHRTDYLVWNNYGAEPAAPETVSVTGLGVQILDWAGLWKPLWFTWVEEAMEEMLLYRERLFVASDGSAWEEPPEEYAPLVATYRALVYDMLYGEGYIAPELTGYTPETP